ncbi:MAG: gephyrin-like molybdotransferase Glp [Candidatus Hodarchaeota archaeon]
MSNTKRFLTALSVHEFEALMEEIDCKIPRLEIIRVDQALSRVLAEDISSNINVPPFHKSRVDGYAVKAEDTFEASEETGITLNVIGEVKMGKGAEGKIQSGQTIYVPTGGMIPEGADAVVKIEYTKKTGGPGTLEKKVEIFTAVTPGQSITPLGADLKEKSVFLEKNTSLTTARLGSLAAAGIEEIKVFEKIRVGLFSSGNEIVEPGKELSPGKIYDVNSLTVKFLILESGCDVNFYGIVGDEMNFLRDIFSQVLSENDVIICSGGTSKGRGDLMPVVIEEHPGTTIEVHGVKIKPGKPLIFALIEGKPVFVLPGNPTSAMMTYIRLVDPFIRRNNGLPARASEKIKANLTKRVYSEFGRRELKAIILSRSEDGKTLANPVPKGSETITTLLNANGYLEVPENVELIEKDSLIDVILFK